MRISVAIAVVVSALAGAAIAKLPPPTPEQVEAAAAKKEKEKAQLEVEKQLLEKAQDRVAEQYKRTKGTTGAAPATGRTADTNMPVRTKELPGQTAPQGGKSQSAEAHSAPAK